MHRLAVAMALVALALVGGVACDEETFEKPPDYDLAKPIRDLSALEQSSDDLSMAHPDLARMKDLVSAPLDLRNDAPDLREAPDLRKVVDASQP
jgi:hypothetical protein